MGCCRLALALAVVLVHGGGFSPMIGGALAVQAFFVISGFYMALVLHTKYPPGPKSYWIFISNRLIRLWPVYALVLALAAAVFWWGWPAHVKRSGLFSAWVEHWDTLAFSTKAILGGANLFFLGQDWLMFAAVDPQTGLLHLTADFTKEPLPAFVFLVLPPSWSLGVELTFYLIAPLLVRRSVRCLVGLIAASFLVRFATYAMFHHHDPWSYRFFPAELAFFLFGVLAHRLSMTMPLSLDEARRRQIGTGALVVVLLLLGTLRISKDYAVLAAFALCLPFIFEATKSNHLDRTIGELSYSVYLGHAFLAPVLLAGFQRLGWVLSPVVFSGALALASLALAAALHLGVERPIDRFRQLRARQVARPLPGTVS
ncbi:MAG: acyltransferase [Acidobacteria bacterium]|nr:acyltransferase [Acidobacteriota bacterium]